MLPHSELALRLVIAALMGSAVGIERERLAWAAGLRTHMLVCVGACLAMIVSAYGFNTVLGTHVVLDPSRVAAQVISGVGFLGAGSIILRNEVVKGLTTAASLWAVAAIGLAVGGGLYIEAAVATVVILIILAGMKPLEERYLKHRRPVEVQLQVKHGTMSLTALRNALGWRASRVKQMTLQPCSEPGADEVTLMVESVSPRDLEELVGHLSTIAPIANVRIASLYGAGRA